MIRLQKILKNNIMTNTITFLLIKFESKITFKKDGILYDICDINNKLSEFDNDVSFAELIEDAKLLIKQILTHDELQQDEKVTNDLKKLEVIEQKINEITQRGKQLQLMAEGKIECNHYNEFCWDVQKVTEQGNIKVKMCHICNKQWGLK